MPDVHIVKIQLIVVDRATSEPPMFAQGVALMSEIINHLEGLKAQLHEWLTIMSDDPHFAPPAWVMESMWTRLNLIISLVPSEEL